MVRLTITPAILQVLQELQDRNQLPEALAGASEPSLDQPATGTHGQIIAISKALKKGIRVGATNGNFDTQVSYHLDDLLRGCRVYVEPPKPKAEPVGSTYLQFHYTGSLIHNRPRSTKPSWPVCGEKRRIEPTSA